MAETVKIIVFDVAADSGGALSTLYSFANRVKTDEENEYVFVTSVASVPEASNIECIQYPWVKQSWFHRLAFDAIVARRLIASTKSDEAVSLQNMLLPFCSIPQTVYLQTVLPSGLSDYKTSFLREPKLWVYQNVIGRFIVRSLKRCSTLVVQADWIKRRCIDSLNVDGCSVVVDKEKLSKVECSDWNRERSHDEPYIFAYPASGFSYKNHGLIVDALKQLDSETLKRMEVIFTLDGNENRYTKGLKKKAAGLPIQFSGWKPKEQMNCFYDRVDCLLFPSTLETVGLPLLEARSKLMPILAPNLDYALDVLSGYERVSFFDPSDSTSLANLLQQKVTSANSNCRGQ
ncbi:glycosyltransferase [Adlercreutzia sp. R25]|uniref:glycosyltransferase n=1 Tax=Adlercreutzia shanghongiae TaxID=3111773 RepID=UPI002DC0275A|nr:glycosyltransferase [Adlercreutzia sp. R25]MEC4273872.1 glycosyltransferase [Adlercreutzia sp. R25]